MTRMNENKQVKLFFGVNFGLTLVMGILMGIGYFLGRDISSFPAAQMLYPAAGVMAVLLAAGEKEQKLPMKFFVTYFVVLALTMICAALSIIIPLGNVIGVGEGWHVIQSYVFIVGGVAALVLLLGVIWGLWHLPINLFYYSPDTWLQSILIQIIACICYSVFFGFAYSRTGNVWTAVVLHYINNNVVAVLTGSADFGGCVYSWKDLLMVLIVNGFVYLPFLFTKEYNEEK